MKKIQLQVTDELAVTVIPNSLYEFIMPTIDVASGYGVSIDCVRRHKKDNADELIEGTHFLSSVRKTHARSNSASYSDNLQSKQIFWTKAGIIRLGFFIKSQKAKQFRNWAENLILAVGAQAEQRTQQSSVQLQSEPHALYINGRTHKELVNDCEIDVLRLLMGLEPTKLRVQIARRIQWLNAQIQ